MALNETYQIERTKWDNLAQMQLSTVDTLALDDDFQQYAQRVATMVGISDFLGDLTGKHVLEYGCGTGEISVLLAKSGAKVTSFDLSSTSIAVTCSRAESHKVSDDLHTTVAAGENLPFANESFDVIFGKAILHHLNVRIGWSEIYRLLKTGGKAAFVEPMGMNPVLNLVREHVPYPHKNPRGADRPLNYQEINLWGKQYRDFYYQEIQLLSMLERGLGFYKRLGLLRRLDNILLEHLPFLRRYCRYVVMFMVK